MPSAPFLFYLPESFGSADRIVEHWTVAADQQPISCLGSPTLLEARLKSDPPALFIDLGIGELFDQVVAGNAKKSQRFLECCPFSTRLAVDLRPYVFEKVAERSDLDLWDAVGKQLAWRLSAHKMPTVVMWLPKAQTTFKPLAVFRDSVELWAGPELIHHNEPKPPEGGRPPISRLCDLLKI